MKHSRKLSIVTWLGAAAALAVAQPAATQPANPEVRWFRSVRQLTTSEMGLTRAGEAYFSPDGKRVSFQAYPTGKEEYQIYVINVDGTGLKMVSTGVGATTCSFFHPSGEKLIFAANHEDLRDAPKPPTRPQGHGGGESAAGHGKAEQPQSQPASAPASRPRGGPGYGWKYFPGMDIYEYTFATGALKRLFHDDGYDAECAYSPDGKLIVFSSMRDGDQEIYICDADGANPRRITHAAGGDGGPFFSPDGKRIVYRSDRLGNGNLQVFINNLAGTAEKLITPDDAFHWCPFWHPSGKWLIFTYANFQESPRFDLYLIRDDGSDRQRVSFEGDFNGLPVFSPDGRYLMWTSKRNGIDAPQVFIAEFVGLTPAGELRAAAAP
jgi:Tol biopolymer transport system component